MYVGHSPVCNRLVFSSNDEVGMCVNVCARPNMLESAGIRNCLSSAQQFVSVSIVFGIFPRYQNSEYIMYAVICGYLKNICFLELKHFLLPLLFFLSSFSARIVVLCFSLFILYFVFYICGSFVGNLSQKYCSWQMYQEKKCFGRSSEERRKNNQQMSNDSALKKRQQKQRNEHEQIYYLKRNEICIWIE